MAMQQLQEVFSVELPLQSVGSGNKRERNRDDCQQQWGVRHRQSASNKQEYGLRHIKKNVQK
jgi:hypothetical protein